MGVYASAPTYRLMIIAGLYMECQHPLPVDLVFELNSRGIVFDQEELLS